jgi:hypothetical protein
MTTAVSLDLSPDAPHTPQRTAELAGRLAEIVRVLGEATREGADEDRPAPGIGWPVAPEDLLDRLARLAEGTEELYPRLADALGRHQDAGTWRVAPVTGFARDLDEDLATVAEHLNEAATLAADIARHLYQARNLLSCVRPNYPRTEAATPRDADGQGQGQARAHTGEEIHGAARIRAAEAPAPPASAGPPAGEPPTSSAFPAAAASHARSAITAEPQTSLAAVSASAAGRPSTLAPAARATVIASASLGPRTAAPAGRTVGVSAHE